MKKFTLSLIAGALSLCCAPFAQAAEVPAGETDITTLEWVDNGQGCAKNFGVETGLAFGTDAGGAKSYVDVSAYGTIKLYGNAGEEARLFINRDEYDGDNSIFYVTADEDGVATFDCNLVLDKQPMAQRIYLNGVKAKNWDGKLNLSMITVSGDAITFPVIPVLPADETDIKSLVWVNEAQTCDKNFGKATGATIFGTDAGPADGKLSYVNITNYGTLKIYGKAGDVVRLFINRAEYTSNFQFPVTIDEDGIGTFNIAGVYANQPGAEYVHLNGIKGNYGATPLVYLIGLTEKPFTCPEGETDIVTLPWVNEGQTCETNNFDKVTGATIYGTDAGPNGDQLSYVDITKYGALKLYGRSGDVVRLFVNRAEYPGNFQIYVTISDDGYGTLDLADVYTMQPGATYVHLNGVKTSAPWNTPPSPTGDAKVKGITLSGEKALFAVHTSGTLTDEYGVNHIAKNSDDVWAANSIALDDACEYKLDMDVLAAEVNYLRTVTSDRWNAVCLPCDVPAAALAGYEVLILKGLEGDNVVFSYLEEGTDLEAHTPCLIKTTGTELAFNLTDVTVKATDDAIANGTGVKLVGVYKAQRIPEGCYGLAGGDFHKASATNDNVLKPYRAYLQTVSGKQMLKIAINGGTTAIEGIEAAEPAQNGVFYNLKGQKVNNPSNGVYILNGVKVLVK